MEKVLTNCLIHTESCKSVGIEKQCPVHDDLFRHQKFTYRIFQNTDGYENRRVILM